MMHCLSCVNELVAFCALIHEDRKCRSVNSHPGEKSRHHQALHLKQAVVHRRVSCPSCRLMAEAKLPHRPDAVDQGAVGGGKEWGRTEWGLVGKSLTTTPPGHFFGQPAVPRWSHATLVARPTGVLSFADVRTRKVRDGGAFCGKSQELW